MDVNQLHTLIKRHVEYTNSIVGRRILESWEEILPRFVKIMPIEYRRALAKIREREIQNAESSAVTEESVRIMGKINGISGLRNERK